MAEESGAARGWPADVIHVNEDGWVLINRGMTADVFLGMRLLVVGSGTRELRDLFAAAAANGGEAPLVLRLRRTYELLEVVYVEDECAVAVAERAPAARRPQFYRGPSGELLVWVPLPDDYAWPPVEDAQMDDMPDEPEDDADGDGNADAENEEDVSQASGDDASAIDDAAGEGEGGRDEPPGTRGQEDQRWEEALPLNSVSVGDIVVPAVPATPNAPGGDFAHASSSVTGGTIQSTTGTVSPGHPAWDKHYDWMGPKPQSSGS